MEDDSAEIERASLKCSKEAGVEPQQNTPDIKANDITPILTGLGARLKKSILPLYSATQKLNQRSLISCQSCFLLQLLASLKPLNNCVPAHFAGTPRASIVSNSSGYPGDFESGTARTEYSLLVDLVRKQGRLLEQERSAGKVSSAKLAATHAKATRREFGKNPQKCMHLFLTIGYTLSFVGKE
ncbi:hypothetical protein EV401DRAFT_1883873 [Pisolithus croceorrhizus]|nr:hypothetical protein EV401DRAFT_1883873 [Pisolithus croceorrhizus]